MAAFIYFRGNLAEYIGRTEDAYGRKWYEVRLLEGYSEGETRLVSKANTRIAFTRTRTHTPESTTMKTIDDFELVDHGIEHSQFFQGCGVAYTNFEHVVTGIGDNPAEAIGDCLEQMAMNDFETENMEARIAEEEYWGNFPLKPSVAEKHPNQSEESELHYHVSIRWNEAKTSPTP